MTSSSTRTAVADSADFRTFMRLSLKHAPMNEGNVCRQFVRCRKCKCFSFYDFVPFSLSGALSAGCCGIPTSKLTHIALVSQQVGKARRTVERQR